MGPEWGPPRALTPSLGTREERVLIQALSSRTLVAQAHPIRQSLWQCWGPQDCPARILCPPVGLGKMREGYTWRQGKGAVSKIEGMFFQEVKE